MSSRKVWWKACLILSNSFLEAKKKVRFVWCVFNGLVVLTTDTALAHLCEFIEDCEFTKLSVRILHLLGVEGPKTSQPTKYIRYIYNRVVLENATVRAAAVTALAKFGVGQKDPEVKRSVSVLLTRCLDDIDDEVRDRAALNLRLMSEEDEMAERFIKNGKPNRNSPFEYYRQLMLFVIQSPCFRCPRLNINWSCM